MNKEKFAKAVFELALEINGGTVRRNGKGHPTAFYDYSGHINRIDVDVYPTGWVHPTGWVADDEPDRFYFNLDKDSDDKLLDEYHRMSVYAVKLWKEAQHD